MTVCGERFDAPDFRYPGGPTGRRGPKGRGWRKSLKRPALGTAAMLLQGPADTQQVQQRVVEATGGAFTPPQDVIELAFGLLAGRGLVTIDDGVATLTELGTNLLSWRGITTDSAQIFLRRAAKYADVIKIRKELHSVARLARIIGTEGTDGQKETLAEVRAQVLEAVVDAKKRLRRALAED